MRLDQLQAGLLLGGFADGVRLRLDLGCLCCLAGGFDGDYGAGGDRCNHGGFGGLVGLLGIAFGFFITVQRLVAIHFTLTLAAVAAAALATGATTGAFAVRAFRAVVQQLFAVIQQFFFARGGGSLLGARLALFTGRTLTTLAAVLLAFTRLTGFAGLALLTGLTLFAGLAFLAGLAF
ncbi:hypothetical protein, partial [Acinetobacter junii]|uniref:hypothetical protein n=1 Tax=Acinetobacter junii TaxID=40215 RepID=UPI00148F1FD2